MPKGRFAENLVGKSYGLLTVIQRVGNNEKGESLWKCGCSCGKEKIISGVKLRVGQYKSCGCMTGKNFHTGYGVTFIDEIGNRYGKLVVLSRVEDGKRFKWLCKCDCGNTTKVSSSNLKNANKGIKSCGCLYRLPNKQDSAFNALYYTYKKSAQIRNLMWNLSKDDVAHLSKQNCHYCNAIPQNKIHASHCVSEYIYNGIDRVNNSKGYELNNCVPCCKNCNRAKMTMPIDQFKSLIFSIYEHWANKK